MKFSELTYKRPIVADIEHQVEQFLTNFEAATDAPTQIELVKQYFQAFKKEWQSISLGFIRHELNTKDEFYEKEVEHLNETMPVLGNIEAKFAKLLLASPFP